MTGPGITEWILECKDFKTGVLTLAVKQLGCQLVVYMDMYVTQGYGKSSAGMNTAGQIQEASVREE